MNNDRDQHTIRVAFKRYDEFLLATRGVPVHRITRALNRQTPGVDWKGCSRDHMARSYAAVSYACLRSLNLEKLKEDVS